MAIQLLETVQGEYRDYTTITKRLFNLKFNASNSNSPIWGLTLARWDPIFRCGFNYCPIAAGAIPAIRHTRGRQPPRLSPTIPTVARRPRRSSPLPAPALWAIGPRQPPLPPHL